MSRPSWPRLLALPLLAVVLTIVWTLVPVRQLADDFQQWVDNVDRIWGLLVVGLSYTPAVLTFFPASVITLAAGAVLGDTPLGVTQLVVAISLGSTFAACVAFWVGRKIARSWVEHKVANSPRFRALDQAVAVSGFKIVLLTRLSPVFPYTLLNYVYGITRVSFRDYLLASWIGMLPGTVMYVVLGTAAKGITVLIADALEGKLRENLGQLLFLLVGLAATIVVTVMLTRIARKALRAALDESAVSDAPPVPSPPR